MFYKFELDHCCNLTKCCWTRNNKNRGWIGNGNLYNNNKIQYVAFWLVNTCNIKLRTNHNMRGNRDIFSGKSIYNRETISR